MDPSSSSHELEIPAVLICEGDRDLRLALSALLAREGYRAVTAAETREAVSRAIATPPACVVLSLPLPGGDPSGFLQSLRGLGEMGDVGVVLIAPRELVREGPAGFNPARDLWLPPTFRPEDLLAAVREAVALKSTVDSRQSTVNS